MTPLQRVMNFSVISLLATGAAI